LYLLADDRPLYPQGTELAHAFDAAWPDLRGGLDMPQSFPLSGVPVWGRDEKHWSLAVYRWRLTDAVPFERSISLRIEPGNIAAEAPADEVRATLFWYSERSGPPHAER
jgi:hypothetical protein